VLILGRLGTKPLRTGVEIIYGVDRDKNRHKVSKLKSSALYQTIQNQKYTSTGIYFCRFRIKNTRRPVYTFAHTPSGICQSGLYGCLALYACHVLLS